MKMYKKPVIEVTGLDVEDIITSSISNFGGDADATAAFNKFVQENSIDTTTSEAITVEW